MGDKGEGGVKKLKKMGDIIYALLPTQNLIFG